MRFKQFKPTPLLEAILDEVSMSPSSLQAWLASPEAEGMLMGIEFEMCVPWNVEFEGTDEDYVENQPATSIDDIVEFFELDNRVELRLRRRYDEWKYEKIHEYFDDHSTAFDRDVRSRIRQEYVDSLEDYAEKVKERLEIDGEEMSDSEIANAAYDMREFDIDEIINNQEDEWEYAYNEVRDDWTDQLERDGTFDEDTWLAEEGMDDMDSVSNRIGFDWPGTQSEYGGGLDVAAVANNFSEHINGPVEWSYDYHGAYRRPGSWVIEPDGSIDTESVEDAGLEFVSPPQPIAIAIESLSRLWEWARKYKCYTNSSTGLHINISVPEFSREDLDYIKLAIFSGDRYILEKFGRLGNTYCKSATSLINQRINDSNALEVLNIMKSNLSYEASKIIHSGYTDKYTSINTKDGYVEFRGPGGDYLSRDPADLIHTALRLAMSLNIACDENAHKKEYAKKLYQLIAPRDSNNDVVSLFSKYSAGELNKKELVTVLQHIQKTRQGVKPEAEKPVTGIKLIDVINNPKYHDILNMRNNWVIYDSSNPNHEGSPWSNATPQYIYNSLFNRVGLARLSNFVIDTAPSHPDHY